MCLKQSSLPAFLFVSKVMHSEFGGRGERLKELSVHCSISMPWWMIKELGTRESMLLYLLVHTNRCIQQYACAYVWVITCVWLHSIFTHSVAYVYVVVCVCAWILFGTDIQLQHMPGILSATLSFGLCDLFMHSKLLSTSATPSTLHDDPHQFS